MPIPYYQKIMLPFLQELKDQKEHTTKEVIDKLANHFNLTEEDRGRLFSSGLQPVFNNRVGWARTYLKKAGLLDNRKRGVLQITQRGLGLLKTNPVEIDNSLLKQYPEFIEFINGKKEETSLPTDNLDVEGIKEQQTPQEVIDSAYQSIRQSLVTELLDKIKSAPAIFFETLVVRLLVKMGYGGSVKDAGKATKYTNDEGIDGIIKEDKLGLDFIYIQAKRWTDASVGRPDIQSFVGALDGQKATKGIFITTSTFAKSAVDYVKAISKKVILIDGQQLAEYMIDYNLGVSTIQTYELKRVDNDYFEE